MQIRIPNIGQFSTSDQIIFEMNKTMDESYRGRLARRFSRKLKIIRTKIKYSKLSYSLEHENNEQKRKIDEGTR